MLNVYEEIGDTSRRKILAELRSGPKSVNQIVEATELKQPNVSNHLARMRMRGIVKATKSGRQVYYSLANPEVERAVHSVFESGEGKIVTIDFDELSKQFAKSAVQGDEGVCSDIMDALFRRNVPMLDIYQELLSPAMELVGTWYKVAAIDEAQEHMASSITERMMARTVFMAGITKKVTKTAILGCAAGSWHVIGLRMISDYMRFRGWRVLFLGADVPTTAFLTAVRHHRPAVVLVSCSTPAQPEECLELLEGIASLRKKQTEFTIGVGGLAIDGSPQAYLDAGADFYARDLREFSERMLPELEKAGKTSLSRLSTAVSSEATL